MPNRQQTEVGPLDRADDVLGRAETRRWNTLHEWVVSAPVAHPALVSDADFVAVQAVYTTPEPVDGQIREHMLAGLMFCKVCQRRMVSHWVHDRESYRCMHGRTSAHIRRKDRQRTVYARQDEDFLFLATHLPQLRGLYDGHLADPTTARQVLDAFHGERELAVRCDNYTWRVEIDDDLAFDGFPVRLPRKKTARRPRTARTPPERSSGANALGVQLLCPRGDLNPHALYGH
ncbi:hypothetical protein CS0771_31510 [Catellatospora sp. IY07-71]|nr:hypothetical protein CS0771_31510 [Catellatospora sp. IY07-71]